MRQIPVVDRDKTLKRRLKKSFNKEFTKLVVLFIAILVIGITLSTIAYNYKRLELTQDQSVNIPSTPLASGQDINSSSFGFLYGYFTQIIIESKYSQIHWTLYSRGTYINLNDQEVKYNINIRSGNTNSTNYEMFLNDSNLQIIPFSTYYLNVVNNNNKTQNVSVIVNVLSPKDIEIYGFLNYISIPMVIFGIIGLAIEITRKSNAIYSK
ncbi:hypothetical protein ACNF40_00030 [Cuniculiplasma sp. SKW4]|uniref:hypothetical protein n=1 Tax=Cuniculiplasma sp. SKW4 TaxID=3400171 RepID=UPI003FD08B2E